MTADINQPSALGPDHQLPAHVPWYFAKSQRCAHIIIWGLALLVLLVALLLIWRATSAGRKGGGDTSPPGIPVDDSDRPKR